MDKILILIDTSYTAFYRFFATIKWFSFAFKEDFLKIKDKSDYNWINNDIFVEKYEKMFLESIKKIISKKTFNSSKIIFCLDSPKIDLWRCKLQSSYKGKRADLSLKYNYKDIFIYTYNTLLPKIIKSYDNINLIQVDNIEADDIIAIIIKHLKNISIKNKIYLISGDQDFYQLGYNNLFFFTYKSKNFKILDENEAHKELQKKIIFGDKSDCIPSILTKRIKNKDELIEDSEKLNKYLNDNPEAKEKYIHNTKMIDFNYIPSQYFNIVVKKFLEIY